MLLPHLTSDLLLEETLFSLCLREATWTAFFSIVSRGRRCWECRYRGPAEPAKPNRVTELLNVGKGREENQHTEPGKFRL